MNENKKQIEEMSNADKDLMRLCKLLFENWDGTVINAAKTVLEHYQPKIPKDSIVLSREEYDKLKAENDKYVKDCIDYIATINKLENKVWEVEQQARKETVEKILREVTDCMCSFEDDDDGYLLKKGEFKFFIREIATHEGVEIKE